MMIVFLSNIEPDDDKLVTFQTKNSSHSLIAIRPTSFEALSYTLLTCEIM